VDSVVDRNLRVDQVAGKQPGGASGRRDQRARAAPDL